MASNKIQNIKRNSGIPKNIIEGREKFMRTFLKRGFELTEEVLQENQKLRDEYAQLETDNARLRAQIASEDAIRDLLNKIEGLEKERSILLERSQELKKVKEQHEDRNLQIETELNDLTNLYVASFQLHGTMSLRHVVRHIGDLLFQFIGVRTFIVYLGKSNSKIIEPIGWAGCKEKPPVVEQSGNTLLVEVYLTGKPYMQDDTTSGGTVDTPLAAIPLMVDGEVVGVISVVDLHEHKKKWASVDKELFRLLGVHACTALIAANLYNKEYGPMGALSGIQEKLELEGPGTDWEVIFSDKSTVS